MPAGERSNAVQEVEGVLQRVEVANERELEVLFDGMGWTSRIGSCRLGARTPQTRTDHNSTRYMRDSHFALGKDKNEELHKMADRWPSSVARPRWPRACVLASR